ncbi:MAG: hypothetical protein QOJ04_5674 [Caballeronia sp.]|nr:hypothetical protein [Caballeronia sp.]
MAEGPRGSMPSGLTVKPLGDGGKVVTAFALRLKHRYHADIAFDRRHDLPAHAPEGYRHGLVADP